MINGPSDDSGFALFQSLNLGRQLTSTAVLACVEVSSLWRLTGQLFLLKESSLSSLPITNNINKKIIHLFCLCQSFSAFLLRSFRIFLSVPFRIWIRSYRNSKLCETQPEH
ncbi:hypothetical protein ABKV19_011057 [Rosa sericea]